MSEIAWPIGRYADDQAREGGRVKAFPCIRCTKESCVPSLCDVYQAALAEERVEKIRREDARISAEIKLGAEKGWRR